MCLSSVLSVFRDRFGRELTKDLLKIADASRCRLISLISWIDCILTLWASLLWNILFRSVGTSLPSLIDVLEDVGVPNHGILAVKVTEDPVDLYLAIDGGFMMFLMLGGVNLWESPRTHFVSNEALCLIFGSCAATMVSSLPSFLFFFPGKRILNQLGIIVLFVVWISLLWVTFVDWVLFTISDTLEVSFASMVLFVWVRMCLRGQMPAKIFSMCSIDLKKKQRPVYPFGHCSQQWILNPIVQLIEKRISFPHKLLRSKI